LPSEELEDYLTKLDRELKTGVLSLLVLQVIEKSQEPVHGYRIIQLIKKCAEHGDIELKEGTIYAVCRSLQSQGLIKNDIVNSNQGPPKKVFSVTPMGRKALREGLAKWKGLLAAVDGVLEEAGD
jgi:PadR family transcriptional regulator PadR